MPRAEKGFSLIELMIVVAIVLILAVIAVPNLLRSKLAANETSAVGSLRTMATASITYASAYGDGFPFDLPALGGPVGTTQGTCDHAILIDGVLSTAPFRKSGYKFSYTGANKFASQPAGCGNPGWNNFTITAVPIAVGSTGQRGFYVDESGVIRLTTDGSAPNNTSPALQ